MSLYANTEIERLVKLVNAQDRLIKAKNNLLMCYRTQSIHTDTVLDDIQKWTDKVKELRNQ